MDLTGSYRTHCSEELLQKFDFCEVRNAAAILASTNPNEWHEIQQVLTWFQLTQEDVFGEGGNRSDLATRVDERFREMGWREGRVDTLIKLAVKISPYAKGGEKVAVIRETEVANQGYKVDNFKGRIALDVEWNAKDGYLDRDLAAYRSLYEYALIDAAVIITRTQEDLRRLVLASEPESTKFNTTTTTNLDKLRPRMTRGDAGGCPVLAIAITSRCYTLKKD